MKRRINNSDKRPATVTNGRLCTKRNDNYFGCVDRFMQTRRWVIRLQALTRGWLGRRRAQSRRTYSQHLGEERAAGRVRCAVAVGMQL